MEFDMKRDRPSYRFEQVEQSRYRRDLDAFSAWLKTRHYSPKIIRSHLLRLDRTLTGMGAIPGGNYAPSELCRAFGKNKRPASRLINFRGTQHCFERFLQGEGRLLVANAVDPLAPLRQRYFQHLTELRGFADSTMAQHTSTVTDFLARGIPRGRTLDAISPRDIERFIAVKSRENTRHSMQHVVAHLRAFLRYCFDHGDIRTRLDVIDMPRTYRGELPPRALPWSAIQSLLHGIDRQGKAGRRDYAILHLMACYGLRPAEVAGLRLEDVDWSAQTIRVNQCKTRTELVLPLSSQTVRALRAYLDHDRGYDVSVHSTLFLGVRCPVGPMANTAICEIFKRRGRRCAVDIEGYSAYSLRHSFAMRLLTRGVGVKAIGDVLGHHSIESTCAYLRLDIDALRGVALEVPGVSERLGGHHA